MILTAIMVKTPIDVYNLQQIVLIFQNNIKINGNTMATMEYFM